MVETPNGVRILGFANMPGRLGGDASALFSRNHLNFLSPFIADGALALDDEDELVEVIGEGTLPPERAAVVVDKCPSGAITIVEA